MKTSNKTNVVFSQKKLVKSFTFRILPAPYGIFQAFFAL